MYPKRRVNDSLNMFINDLNSRIVAESGIPTDRFHLGRILIQSLKDAPDFINQIDGSTGESETNSSVLRRAIKCAVNLKKLGIGEGDVALIMAPNHLDLTISIYATWFVGGILVPCDMLTEREDLDYTINLHKPRIIFCQSGKSSEIEEIVKSYNLNCRVVTFDQNGFKIFLDGVTEDDVTKFRVNNINPDAVALRIPTSGSTAKPKAVCMTYKGMSTGMLNICSYEWNFPTPTRLWLTSSTLQWISGVHQMYLTTVVRVTRLQTSQPLTVDHMFYLINTYQPTLSLIGTSFFNSLVKSCEGKCDFKSFEVIHTGGSTVSQTLVDKLKKISPNVDIITSYGLTETYGVSVANYTCVPGSVGRPLGDLQYRIIDINSGKDINKANVPGELLMKGSTIFKEYYNEPEETKASLTEDGWLKTGDMLYRDEHGNLFFYERIKQMMKYKDRQFSPFQIEDVIQQHPAVAELAVTSVPDEDASDLVVACVVPRGGYQITAQDIYSIAKKSLSDLKQLRGGVVFLKELPKTPSMKIDRRKLKEMVLSLDRCMDVSETY